MPALFYLGASKLVVSAGQNRLANASRGRATVLPMRRPHAIDEKAVAVDKVPVRVADGVAGAPEKKMKKLSKKVFENEFNLCCKGCDPRIYENSIFLAYVPEKN
jgi:hypothetical protein